MGNITGRAFNEKLAERYARWLVAQGYAQATRYYYLSAVASFLKFLGNMAATKTTQVEVQEYIASSAAAGCPAYKLRERLYALRIFFDFLCMGGLIAWSPPRIVHMKRLKGRLPKVLNRVEVRKVLKAARSPREKALVELLYGTGVRCGELLSVKVREIDYQNRRFMVRGKAGDRTVLFSPRIAGVLKQYLKGRTSGFLLALKTVASTPKVSPVLGGGWRCRYVVHDAAGRQLKRRTLTIPKQQRLPVTYNSNRSAGV